MKDSQKIVMDSEKIVRDSEISGLSEISENSENLLIQNLAKCTKISEISNET